MEKIKINMSGNTFVNKAITSSGGKSVGRANANLVGGASANVANINQGVASLPKTPAMPKKASGDDLLSHITDGQEEDLKYYIMEKAAGLPVGFGRHLHMGGVDKIVTHSPLPAASSTLYRYGGGLVGGAAAYGAARNDGQGVGGALGFGAFGAFGGNMLGNRVGREVALHGNIAKGHATAALHSTHAEELKRIEKFTHPTDGADHIAEHLLNQRKGLLTTPGSNALETTGNILKGGIAHASGWASHYVDPKLSKLEQYRNTVGHAKADADVADFRKTITEKQQKINEQSGAGRGLADHWKNHGVHDATERYARMGVDIHTVANLRDPMGHWASKNIAGETGNRGNTSLYNSNSFLIGSSTKSVPGAPYSGSAAPGAIKTKGVFGAAKDKWEELKWGTRGKNPQPAPSPAGVPPAAGPVVPPHPQGGAQTPSYNPQGANVSYKLRPKGERGTPVLRPTYLGASAAQSKDFDKALANYNQQKRRS